MIDIVIQLVDRLVKFSQYHQERKKETFEKFVEPIYSEFKITHENFINKLIQYKQQINSSNNFSLDHQIFEEIIKDGILDSARRDELKSLTNAMRGLVYEDFAQQIQVYLLVRVNHSEHDDYYLPASVIRTDLVESLKEVAQSSLDIESKKSRALNILDLFIENRVICNSNVANEYASLKVKLLVPS